MYQDITLITIGYSGNGKSATANTLLGFDAFTKNSSTITMETEPKAKVVNDGSIVYRVVDGLCLCGKDPKDVDMDTLYEAQAAVESCGDGFNAILVVLRYGEKYSKEDERVASVAKRVFGPKVFKQFGICVFTRGDEFKYAVEVGEEPCRTFSEWCNKRPESLKQLICECQMRYCLLDNKTKDSKGKDHLLDMVAQLVRRNANKKYSVNTFHELHSRTFEMSPNKRFEIGIKQQLEEIRNQMEQEPDDAHVRCMLETLNGIHAEITTSQLTTQKMDSLISQAQRLNKNLQLLRKRDNPKESSTHVKYTALQSVEGEKTSRNTNQAVRVDAYQEDLHQHTYPSAEGGYHHKDSIICPSKHLEDKTHLKDIYVSPAGTSHEHKDYQSSTSDDELEQEKGADDTIHLMMLGRSGNGKSSTGNSILGKQTFRITTNFFAAEKCIASDRQEFDDLRLNVVDGPSLEDTVMESIETLNIMMESMKETLQLCNYGFSALLVILKFGQRFTKSEKDAIVMIKSILGKDVLSKYGVCVLTHGDQFDEATEGEVEFLDWCKQQTGDIAELFKECSHRCVQFDNKTKNDQIKEVQRKTLLHFVKGLQRYSESEFLEAGQDFDELSAQSLLPRLEHMAKQKLSKIREELEEMELRAPSHNEQYMVQMESLIERLMSYNSRIDEFGQNPATDYIKQLIMPLQMLMTSKLTLCRRKDELRKLETERQLLDNWNIPSEIPNKREKLASFIKTTEDRLNTISQQEQQQLGTEIKKYIAELEACGTEALDDLCCRLHQLKDKLEGLHYNSSSNPMNSVATREVDSRLPNPQHNTCSSNIYRPHPAHIYRYDQPTTYILPYENVSREEQGKKTCVIMQMGNKKNAGKTRWEKMRKYISKMFNFFK